MRRAPASSILRDRNPEETMMRRPVLALSLLAALAVLGPRAAAACDDHRRAPMAVSVPLPAPLPLPPPWVAGVLPPPPLVGPMGPASLSVTYAWLDANRAAYARRWGWNPWRMARYDSWYAGFRAGLDARAAGPALHARGWARGHGPGHDRGRHD
jgi:hypothetical protein